MDLLSEDWLLSRMMLLIPLIFSLTVHEWAHAWSAWKLGDDTAQREGRLTLNPVAHMDPVGSLMLPLLGVPFGWAKPVPVNIGRFHRSVGLRSGILLTVGAGPISNVCLAIASAAVLLVSAMAWGGLASVPRALHSLLDQLIFLNTMLALFNLLPIPPLDGSRIVDCLLPDALRPIWDGFCRLGPVGIALALVTLLLVAGEYVLFPAQAAIESVDIIVRQLAG